LDSPPPPSLLELDKRNLVIYLSTFSKTLAPGLRLGSIVAAEPVVEQLALVKQRSDLFSGNLGQLVLAEFLNSGLFDAHLQVLRAEHNCRRNALADAFRQHLPRRALT